MSESDRRGWSPTKSAPHPGREGTTTPRQRSNNQGKRVCSWVPACIGSRRIGLFGGGCDSARRWYTDVPNQARKTQELDQVVGHVDLPPEEALVGRTLVVVVVVVPALAESEQGHPPVVAAAVRRVVTPTPPKMADRVDHESRVVSQDGAQEKAPDQAAPSVDEPAQARQEEAREPMEVVKPA